MWEGFIFSYQEYNLCGAWLCSRLRNGQFIFAYYRVLRDIISVKPLPGESSLLLTKNGQYFGALRTVIMEKFISLRKSPSAGKLGMSAVFQRQTILCSPISCQIKSLYSCKPPEKARTKVRTSMVCQWLPVVNFLCF